VIFILIFLGILLFGSLSHEIYHARVLYLSDKRGETLKGGNHGSSLREDETEAR